MGHLDILSRSQMSKVCVFASHSIYLEQTDIRITKFGLLLPLMKKQLGFDCMWVTLTHFQGHKGQKFVQTVVGLKLMAGDSVTKWQLLLVVLKLV